MTTEYTKPYLPDFTDFVIKYFSLKKVKYTCSDFLFKKEYQDFVILYNPRCQMVDITPNIKDHSLSNLLWKHQCEKMLEIAQKTWDDLSYEYFLTYGVVPDSYVNCRLYGVSCSHGSFPYVTRLSKVEIDEWSEVENWNLVAKRFMKSKYFKYACWGTIDGYKQKGNPTTLEKKEIRKQRPKRLKLMSSETYAEKWYFRGDYL